VSSPSREERRSRLDDARALAQRDKRRLMLLVAGLAAILFLYWQAKRVADNRSEPLEPQPEQIESLVQLPPVDKEALQGVRDATPTERAILESEAFADLARMALALLPAHLRLLGEPALPFDTIEADAAGLRGDPVRVRGTIESARPVRRSPDAPEEYWSLLRTDDGHEVHFVSLQIPEDLFRSENYVLADGYFFKLYTTNVEDRVVTAPLIVGRALVPSYHRAAPVEQLDAALLAGIRDASLSSARPIAEDGYWHLLNYAGQVAADPARLEAEFAGAPEFKFDMLQALLEEPALYRGRPFLIPGRVVRSYHGWERAPENPMRLDYTSWGYLGSDSLGMHAVHLMAAGRFPMQGTRSDVSRIFRGWFLQWESYQDKESTMRLAPVFVVADVVEVPLETPPLFNTLSFAFLGLALLLGGLMLVLLRKDRARAVAAAKELQERRRNRRGEAGAA